MEQVDGAEERRAAAKEAREVRAAQQILASLAPHEPSSITAIMDPAISFDLNHGETTLHVLIRQQGTTAVDVANLLEDITDEDTRIALVNAKDFDGVTPLMVAAKSHGGYPTGLEMVKVAHLLLATGATATVFAHSSTRRTAADYASEHGKPGLARALRELERDHAEEEDADRRCQLCGDRLAGCKFSSAQRDVARGAQKNPLIQRFFHNGGTGGDERVFRTLAMPLLHGVNNKAGFTREFTECLAMLESLQRIVQAASDGEGGEGEPWHVLDLCCGKARPDPMNIP